MEDETLDQLTGDLRELAEVVGVENALKVAEKFGGSYLVIGKAESLKRARRDRRIRELYDAGQLTIRQLALRFKISSRRISAILKQSD